MNHLLHRIYKYSETTFLMTVIKPKRNIVEDVTE